MGLPLIIKIVLMLLVFMTASSAAQYVAGVLPGTPTNQLSEFLDGRKSASALLAALESSQGAKLLTQHSNWILLLFHPVASICSAFVGRMLRVSSRTVVVVVGVIVLATQAAMSFNPLAGDSPLGVVARGVGASLLVQVVSVVLCITLAALVGYGYPSGRKKPAVTLGDVASTNR